MLLLVKVKPGARRNEVRAWDPRTLTVELAVSAPPVDGKANAAVLNVLADLLGCAPSRLALKTGASARTKRVEVPDGTDLTGLTVARRREAGP
jgi:uncharacterized protein (TIGR00251 family)